MIQKAQFEPNNRSFEARLEMSNHAEQLSEVGTALSRPKASNSNSFIYQGGAQSDWQNDEGIPPWNLQVPEGKAGEIKTVHRHIYFY